MFRKKAFNVSTGICGVLAAGTVLRTRDTETESKNTQQLRKTVLDGYELKQVQIFVRHGARTPIHTVANVQQVPISYLSIIIFVWFIVQLVDNWYSIILTKCHCNLDLFYEFFFNMPKHDANKKRTFQNFDQSSIHLIGFYYRLWNFQEKTLIISI